MGYDIREKWRGVGESGERLVFEIGRSMGGFRCLRGYLVAAFRREKVNTQMYCAIVFGQGTFLSFCVNFLPQFYFITYYFFFF